MLSELDLVSFAIMLLYIPCIDTLKETPFNKRPYPTDETAKKKSYFEYLMGNDDKDNYYPKCIFLQIGSSTK